MDFDIEDIAGILDDLMIFIGIPLILLGQFLVGIIMVLAGLALMYIKGELSFGKGSGREEVPPVEKPTGKYTGDEEADEEEGYEAEGEVTEGGEGDEGEDGDGDGNGNGNGDE
ncbi:hypothetical protein HY991_01485 [Candidatus Micrarchaeota archaeon]|nr:hypothetical protein [Candidatus Micrarchaeota archaeon]